MRLLNSLVFFTIEPVRLESEENMATDFLHKEYILLLNYQSFFGEYQLLSSRTYNSDNDKLFSLWKKKKGREEIYRKFQMLFVSLSFNFFRRLYEI